MAAKTQRIEMRTDEQSGQRILNAAQATNMNVSAFVLAAATAAADRVLGRSNAVLMPAEQFDQLISSLDVPDEAPRLAGAAAKRRRFVRK